MSKIYLLQVMFNFNNYEHHYENVYSSLELAKQVGEKWLENELRKEYEDWFEEDTNANVKRKELSKEQLFKLKTIYDFTITEFELETVEQLENKNSLPVVNNIHNSYFSNLSPAKIEHCFDYNGKEIYISGVYIYSNNGEKRVTRIMMDYEDYTNPFAGTKFKKGDIVRIKKDYDSHLGDYNFYDKLHVIMDVPHRVKNSKFFRNSYEVIVNHNIFDEGCYVDVFNEKELELYTKKLPKDSPILFLSKYFKGEIKLKNNTWKDIESGRITLNENTSFRDVPEIMKQMKGRK